MDDRDSVHVRRALRLHRIRRAARAGPRRFRASQRHDRQFVPESIAFGRPTTEVSGGPGGRRVVGGSHVAGADRADARRHASRRGHGTARTVRMHARAREPHGRRADRRHEVRVLRHVGLERRLHGGRPRRRPSARQPGLDPAQNVPAGTPSSVPRFDGNFERLRVDSDGRGGARDWASRWRAGHPRHDRRADYAGRPTRSCRIPLPWAPAGNASAVPVPAPAGNEFTVASFNMERLFDDVNGGGDDVTMTPDAYQRRLRKASLGIRTVMQSPDIIGVQEVEHESTLQALAARINADTVEAHRKRPSICRAPGRGQRPRRHRRRLPRQGLARDHRLGHAGRQGHGIPAARFQHAGSPQRSPVARARGDRRRAVRDDPWPVTVIVNHLRSLLPSTIGTTARACATSASVRQSSSPRYVQSRQTANPAERIVSVGDYNAFQFSDGFVDVMGAIQGTPAPAKRSRPGGRRRGRARFRRSRSLRSCSASRTATVCLRRQHAGAGSRARQRAGARPRQPVPVRAQQRGLSGIAARRRHQLAPALLGPRHAGCGTPCSPARRSSR